MEPVLFYGTEKDRETETVVARAIAAAGGRVVSVSEKAVEVGEAGGNPPEFLLLRFGTAPAVAAGRGIVVMKQELPLLTAAARPLPLPGGFVAVADSANAEAVELLRKTGVCAVICGMSQKDSVTFSSLDAESAVVSVQRELRTLRGGTVEPGEISVAFTAEPPSGYPLLAAVTVLLLGEALGGRTLRL